MFGWVAAGCGSGMPTHASLYDAAVAGDMADIKRHIRCGSQVDQPGPEGWTALMVAAYRGDREMLRYLLRLGASPAARNDYGATALMSAVHNGQCKSTEWLLASGADCNACTPGGADAIAGGDSSGRHSAGSLPPGCWGQFVSGGSARQHGMDRGGKSGGQNRIQTPGYSRLS